MQSKTLQTNKNDYHSQLSIKKPQMGQIQNSVLKNPENQKYLPSSQLWNYKVQPFECNSVNHVGSKNRDKFKMKEKHAQFPQKIQIEVREFEQEAEEMENLKELNLIHQEDNQQKYVASKEVQFLSKCYLQYSNRNTNKDKDDQLNKQLQEKNSKGGCQCIII